MQVQNDKALTVNGDVYVNSDVDADTWTNHCPNISAARAIQYARTLAPDELRAVHVACDLNRAEELAAEWRRLGLARVPLELVDCPDRRIARSVLEVVAEATAAFESAEQPRVAGSMPEATVLQRRAAVAPGSARSFAEAEAQARRLAESEVSAAQAVAVLPAAQDAAVVLRAEQHAVVAPQAAARDVAEAPRQAAEVRVGAAVLRPEEAAAQAGVAEVVRRLAARGAAEVLRPAAPGVRARARARPSAVLSVFRPDRLHRRPAPSPAARFARAMARL